MKLETLTLSELAKLLDSDHDAVIRELHRRANPQPGQVWVFASVPVFTIKGKFSHTIDSQGNVGGGQGWGAFHEAMRLCPDTMTGDRVGLFTYRSEPHPDGWWTGYRLAGPEHYAALQLVKEQSGGGLDVSRAIHLWSRDEFTGEGRFLAYYRDADSDGTLFCHSRFWALLDAMAMLDDIGLLTKDLARIPGKVVRLGGKTQLLPLLSTEDSTTQTLVYVFREGPTCGSDLDQVVPAPRPGGPAFVHHHDWYLPTQQEWSAVLVALAEGDVLPLEDGRGITLKDGVPYLVPGLARSQVHHVWARARAL